MNLFRHKPETKSLEREHRLTLEDKTTDKPVSLIVRNCSSIECMHDLSERFGYVARFGRYFVPETTDLETFSLYCKENGLHLRKTDLGSVVVLDIMRDRELRRS